MYETNKNARIETRVDRTGKVRTETTRRDAWTPVIAASTNERSNSTAVYLDLDDNTSVRLSGREARTLYRLLSRHYAQLGKVVA